MTLRGLEYFLAVYEEGSFTRAARRVHVSQPSLSQQIRALENELGGQLIERLPRAIRLTPTGRALLPHARAAVLAAERGAREARATLTLQGGQLEIAAVRSLVVTLLPPSIKRWQEAHPQTNIRLHEYMHHRDLAEAVRVGVGDIAIGPPPADWQGPMVTIGWQEFIVVLPFNDPLAGTKDPLRLEQLADRGWVLFEEHHGLTDFISVVCAQAGFHPRGVVRTSQVDAAAGLAAAGLGPTIVPAGSLPPGAQAAGFRLDPPPGYEITAYTRGEWAPLAAAYLAFLQGDDLGVPPEGAYRFR